MLLSILMPTLAERRELRRPLLEELWRQLGVPQRFYDGNSCLLGWTGEVSGTKVELLLFEDDGTESPRSKMGRAYADAGGDYACVVDDDDMVAGCYVESLVQACLAKPDVVTFELMRLDLGERWVFRCGPDRIPHVNGGLWHMKPNQLCAWKTAWAREVPWPEESWLGSDVAWYTEMHRRHPNPAEVHVPKLLYVYRWNPGITKSHREVV